jgi:hypothetical protein
MTQNDIIEMARQAGALPVHRDPKNKAIVGNDKIEAFAKLVEAKASAKEREACASINFRMCLGFSGDQCYQISELIRARGEQQ